MSALKSQRSVAEVRKSEDVVKKAVHYPFWFGGSASCCATLFTHPLDLVKVGISSSFSHGIELTMTGPVTNASKWWSQTEHVANLSAAQLRQITYSMTRFGVYETLKDRFTTADSKPSFLTLVGMASISGFLGGFAGNPGDILNVRMQHDSALPPEKRRNVQARVQRGSAHGT
ncbi:hypothetical protein OPT61_g6180 [Boeremia exigua]|uniref:Uncharacterized protein n=1 Tax=Boeremia exigua TaxID=749465 RepID=A0ACC2I7K9_9PLEO|nr:hypothetical protein OPT61_g6180 [Boeremia exigua]